MFRGRSYKWTGGNRPLESANSSVGSGYRQEVRAAMKAYYTSGTCAIEEWIGVDDAMILAVQKRRLAHWSFPRIVFISSGRIVIRQRQRERSFAANECRWWEGTVGNDDHIALTVPVQAIVVEVRTQLLKSTKVTIAL